MDTALEQFRCSCTPTDYRNGIKMLHVYTKNIHDHPTIPKYRKIRTGNEKFNSNVWRHETCRTILLLAGFEQVGEFIELSNNADVSILYNLLQQQLTDDVVPAASTSSSSTTTVPPPQRNATLNLAASGQGGLFAADVKADLTLLSYMVEMGYSKHASERGLVATNNQGVQPAMDWIASHPECQIAPPAVETAQHVSMPSATTTTMPSTSTRSDDTPAVTSRLRNANEQKMAYQEKLRLEAIKKAKLEKAEDQMAKKNLKKNLQSEKQEKLERFEREKVIRHDVDKQEKLEQTSAATAHPPHDENVSTIRIRSFNGKMFIWETSKETRVKDLYAHACSLVQDIPTEDIQVCVPHPHEVLLPDDETTLQNKGLYPKATVAIQKTKQDEEVEGGGDTMAVDEEVVENDGTADILPMDESETPAVVDDA